MNAGYLSHFFIAIKLSRPIAYPSCCRLRAAAISRQPSLSLFQRYKLRRAVALRIVHRRNLQFAYGRASMSSIAQLHVRLRMVTYAACKHESIVTHKMQLGYPIFHYDPPHPGNVVVVEPDGLLGKIVVLGNEIEALLTML